MADLPVLMHYVVFQMAAGCFCSSLLPQWEEDRRYRKVAAVSSSVWHSFPAARLMWPLIVCLQPENHLSQEEELNLPLSVCGNFELSCRNLAWCISLKVSEQHLSMTTPPMKFSPLHPQITSHSQIWFDNSWVTSICIQLFQNYWLQTYLHCWLVGLTGCQVTHR